MHRANVQYDGDARGGIDWVLYAAQSPPSQRMRLALFRCRHARGSILTINALRQARSMTGDGGRGAGHDDSARPGGKQQRAEVPCAPLAQETLDDNYHWLPFVFVVCKMNLHAYGPVSVGVGVVVLVAMRRINFLLPFFIFARLLTESLYTLTRT